MIVWSAPNYCYRWGNKPTILIIYEECKNKKFEIFQAHERNAKESAPKTLIPYFAPYNYPHIIQHKCPIVKRIRLKRRKNGKNAGV